MSETAARRRSEDRSGWERLLTVEDVAELLAVPVRTLYTWRYRGEGPPALKLGGHLRYEPAALRRWLAGQR
jgi:excisionase family DNA binding protein